MTQVIHKHLCVCVHICICGMWTWACESLINYWFAKEYTHPFKFEVYICSSFGRLNFFCIPGVEWEIWDVVGDSYACQKLLCNFICVTDLKPLPLSLTPFKLNVFCYKCLESWIYWNSITENVPIFYVHRIPKAIDVVFTLMSGLKIMLRKDILVV